jgi:hypothetical protein
MSAVCAAGVIVALSACGVDGGKAQAEPPASASTAPTTSATTSATATPSSAGVKAGDVINGIPTKKELANDGKGNYIQTTIAPDDSAFTFNPAIVSQEEPALFTDAEIKDAQKFIVTFLAEEGLDSTLNDNSADAAAQEAWWARNKEKINVSDRDELYRDVKSNDPNKPIVFRGQFRQDTDTSNKYSLVHGDNVTHIYSRKITPVEIKTGERNGQKLIGVNTQVDFSMNAVLDGKTVVEASSGKVGYTVTKSPEGKWVITGYYSNYTTSPITG